MFELTGQALSLLLAIFNFGRQKGLKRQLNLGEVAYYSGMKTKRTMIKYLNELYEKVFVCEPEVDKNSFVCKLTQKTWDLGWEHPT